MSNFERLNPNLTLIETTSDTPEYMKAHDYRLIAEYESEEQFRANPGIIDHEGFCVATAGYRYRLWTHDQPATDTDTEGGGQ
jgi:hypothetical protein